MSRKFNNRKFIRDVLNDRYALIIGNEAILSPDVEPSGDVRQYLLRRVNESSSVQYDSYADIALDRSERVNPVRRLIENGDIDFSVGDVSVELMSLLRTRLFTTVLTTTTDGYLESAMRQVWGDNLRVVNIRDKETVDEFQAALKKCRRGRRYSEPTLIYVFGKLVADDLAMKYVRTDADAIELIEKWMRMDVESSNEMLDFVRSKRLLALGCKYDDWYFRFFWYVLTGVSKSSEKNDYDGMGEVAFTLDNDNVTECKLHQFLDRTDICILGDARAFISQVTSMLTTESADSPFRHLVVDSRRRGGIFLSYCSKDALTASQLFFQLCDRKYDVWIDSTRLYGGDDYEKEIADAISTSKIFIAVLSPNIAADLEQGDTDHYYNKEWRIAQQFGDKTIIPLAVNGYDLRAPYHQVFESVVGRSVTGYDLMDTDGFQNLLTTLKELP